MPRSRHPVLTLIVAEFSSRLSRYTWRRICPELTVRSTFIVGFPGETEAQFEELLGFLEAAELDRVGCLRYSPVAGAAANALPGAVPEPLREQRWHRFMQTQAAISARRLARRVGRTIEVLVDLPGEDGPALGRSHADAPEIDGVVYLHGAAGLAGGDRVRAVVERADAYDLHARVVSRGGLGHEVGQLKDETE